jgi:2-dehydro-3-deoxygluconokinase
MIGFASKSVVSVGEAMVEMEPVGAGMFRQGFADDTFNTIWHMAQLLDGAEAEMDHFMKGQEKASRNAARQSRLPARGATAALVGRIQGTSCRPEAVQPGASVSASQR